KKLSLPVRSLVHATFSHQLWFTKNLPMAKCLGGAPTKCSGSISDDERTNLSPSCRCVHRIAVWSCLIASRLNEWNWRSYINDPKLPFPWSAMDWGKRGKGSGASTHASPAERP